MTLPLSESDLNSRPLRLSKLELENFRCFEKAEIDFHPELTVLVAENAQGKSAILSASALMLESVVAELCSTRPRPIDLDSVRLRFEAGFGMRSCFPLTLKAEGQIHGAPLSWSRSRASASTRGSRSQQDMTLAVAKAEELKQLAETDNNCLLPVVAFYRTDRLWSSIDGVTRKSSGIQRLKGRWSGYAEWTSPTSSFSAFLTWYRSAFNQLRHPSSKYGDPDFRIDRQIVAVQEAVKTALEPTGWTGISWEWLGQTGGPTQRNDFISIEHESKGRLPLQLLSDGVQNMVALVADLAYRCVVLNPHLGEAAARESSGVVLIDEIDMHLHPRWQQVVIALIRRAFPKIQFVVTTHSPQVLSTVNSESIRLIRLDGAIASITTPQYQTRGIESADILAQLMDVDPVPQVEEAKWLSEYRSLLQTSQQNSPEAGLLWEKIIAHFGADNPVLNEIEVLRRFQEFRELNNLAERGKSGDAKA